MAGVESARGEGSRKRDPRDNRVGEKPCGPW